MSPVRPKYEAERMAAAAFFPNGLGHWVQRPAVPIVARESENGWAYDYGREKIDANRGAQSHRQRVGWAVLFALPEETEGSLEVFPAVRMAHVFGDHDEVIEDV